MRNDSIEKFFDSLAPSWDKKEESTSDERKRILSLFPLVGAKKILDIGCGTGLISGDLAELSGGEVTGIDISSLMIEEAKRKYLHAINIHFFQKDFLSSSFCGYDFAIIYNAYPHFVDPVALSRKVASSLNDGGSFVIVHSMGRDKLRKHHEGVPSDVSRDLGSPQEEAKFFEKEFEVVSSEDDSLFYILFKKRND